MECGKLRHRITIEEASDTYDTHASRTESWSTFAKTKAAIRYLRGNELFVAQQLNAESVAMFTMRWSRKLKTMTEDMRINFDSKIWHITHINNVDYRNRELRVTVSQGLIVDDA